MLNESGVCTEHVVVEVEEGDVAVAFRPTKSVRRRGGRRRDEEEMLRCEDECIRGDAGGTNATCLEGRDMVVC